MKRIIMSIGVIFAAVFTLTNCNKEIDAPLQPEENAAFPFEFSAGIATRTANDGDATVWVAGDALNLYHSPAAASAYVSDDCFTIAESDLETGTFKGTLASPLENGKSYDWVAVYPYSEANTNPSAAKVSIGSAVQTGDSNMTHLAGENFPLWGVAADVKGELSMQMKHMSSILEVEVLNSTTEDITVSTVALTAEEDIAGEFVADLTSAVLAFEPVEGKVSKTSTLTVNSAQNIAKGSSAKYYVAVKPFTAPAGSALTLSVNGIDYKITLSSEVVFAPGAIKPLKFDYDKTAAPTVTVKNVAFSSADLEWTNDGLARSFNIYVNGTKVVSDLAGNVLIYHLTGLVSGVESVIEVEAVGDHNAAKSAQQTIKTAGIRMLDNGRHHVTIEWDEVGTVYNGTAGGGDALYRGYYIGVYEDEACTNLVYEFCPYDGVYSKYNGFSTSSMIGRKNNNGYFIYTRIALGSLDQAKDYYVRVRTLADFEYTFGSTKYIIAHPYGNSEWSSPFLVKTKPAHTPADNEVIFADFDELSIFPDRHVCAIGTMPASLKIGDRSDMRMLSTGYTHATKNENSFDYGFLDNGTVETETEHRDYYNGKYFNVDYNGTEKYDNYIVKSEYELAGWHISSEVYPSMGTLLIEKQRNRMIGTPALTTKLRQDEETPCVLTFDQCVFLNAGKHDDIVNVWIYRDGALSEPIHSYTVTASYNFYTDAKNYEVGYDWTTKSFPLNLKSGDAVLIGTGNEDTNNHIAFDNFKIVVSDVAGSGNLEIPDWSDDNDGLEF